MAFEAGIELVGMELQRRSDLDSWGKETQAQDALK
jgi:hypothetical protein